MQIIGEIRLFAYDDVPYGYLPCDGHSLEVNKYPKLYMMIGNKFGQSDKTHFSLPDFTKNGPKGIRYCIAYKGQVPNIEEGIK